MQHQIDLEQAIPRLVSAYDQGLLVPFTGAGMSRDLCPDWEGLIAALESHAGVTPVGSSPGTDSLVRRANHALRTLKRQRTTTVFDAVRRALYGKTPDAAPPGVPPQTQALARIWWPLVLTTNYDDLFTSQFAREHPGKTLSVHGRGRQDCQRVLSSLTTTAPPILWALQGYAPHPASGSMPEADVRRLGTELVVGHEEYRRVTHTAQHFRRAFAEVFRHRSLLFLGSGLAEPYLLELFSEILEFFGPNPQPHFAMVKRGTVDAAFLRSRFNVLTIEYGEHDELPSWLDRLAEAIEERRPRRVSWGFHLGQPAGVLAEARAPDLAIVHGKLPKPADGECVAWSAGLDAAGNPYLSDRGSVRAEVDAMYPGFCLAASEGRLRRVGQHVYYFPTPFGEPPCRVLAVSAWSGPDKRDVRLVGNAVAETLEWAAGAPGIEHVRMALLSAGRSRHFGARYSLVEIVRAFAQWRKANPTPIRLTVHVVDEEALFDLRTSRLDVPELLSCDDVRFWAEVVDGDELLEREIVFFSPDSLVEDVRRHFALPDQGWAVEVEPPPTPTTGSEPLSQCALLSLRSVGVLPGSTLRFVATDAGARVH